MVLERLVLVALPLDRSALPSQKLLRIGRDQDVLAVRAGYAQTLVFCGDDLRRRAHKSAPVFAGEHQASIGGRRRLLDDRADHLPAVRLGRRGRRLVRGTARRRSRRGRRAGRHQKRDAREH